MAVGETSYNQVSDRTKGIAGDCEGLHLRCAPAPDGLDYRGEKGTEAWVLQYRQIAHCISCGDMGLTVEHSIDSELRERTIS